jgi:glutamyl-tRNA(Gln) amidotransferase subunit E
MLAYLSENPTHTIEKVVKALGLEMMDEDEVMKLIEETVAEKADMIKERGMKAMGPLMGIIMGKVRGKASPQHVNKLLKTAIQTLIK